MTLWWIGNAVLLLVILPVVVLLLHGVLKAARSIVPSVDRIAAAAPTKTIQVKRPTISSAPSPRSRPTWSAVRRWTACSAATSATVRLRSRCAP